MDETLRGAQEAEGAGGVGGPLVRGGGQAREILLDDPLDAVDIEEVERKRAPITRPTRPCGGS